MTPRPRNRIWVTRTQPGADATAGRLTDMGWTPVVAPLLEVVFLAPEIDSRLDDCAALVFTSLNGVDAFAALTPRRDRPVFAVGDATAAAARDAGFADVVSAGGDIHALAALIARRHAPEDGLLLAPGAVQPAGDLPALLPRHRVTRLPVYKTQPLAPPAPDDLHGVLIHSPRAAHALTAVITPDQAPTLHAVCISDAAAAPLKALPFKEIHTCGHPDENSLLTTLGKPPNAV